MSDLIPTGPPPTTAADRLARYAQLDAVARLCKTQMADLKVAFDDDADRIEELTGGAYNVPVKGVGRVYRTDPQVKGVVTDRAALWEWLKDVDPDSVGERHEVVVTDQDAAFEVVFQGVDSSEALDKLMDALTIETTMLLPEDPIAHLEHLGCVLVPDVGMVSPDGVKVPGVATKSARRNLTVKIDTAMKTSLDDRLAAVLELEGPS